MLGEPSKPYNNDDWLAEQLLLHGTTSRIAKANGIPARTLRRHIKAYHQRKQAERIVELEGRYPIAPLCPEIRIDGNGTVSSDWHLPLTSFAHVGNMIRQSVRTGTTAWLAIIGDFFNFDALSRFDEKQHNAGLGIELQAASEVLEIMLDVYDKVYITKGNHDVRFAQSIGYKLKFEDSVRLLLPDIPDVKLKRLVVTSYDYIIIDTPAGPWRASHTNQYSKIPLSVPRELCDIHGMHNAAAHRHHHGITRSKGGYWAVELGGLFDPAKTHYLKQYTNTFPGWTPGWMHLHDGLPYLPMAAPAPPPLYLP